MKFKTLLIAGILFFATSAFSQSTATSVNLAWDYDGVEVTGFKLYAKVGTGPRTLIDTIIGPTQRSATHLADIGTVYCYTVTAYKTIVATTYESLHSNEVCHAVIDRPVLLRIQ